MNEKDLKLSKLPKTWITIKGADAETIKKIHDYINRRDKALPVIFSNLEIEIWVLDKVKGKYVRLSKDPPIKGSFWKKLRETIGVKKVD